MRTPERGQVFRTNPKYGAICPRCQSDLTVRVFPDARTKSRQRSDGAVICSSRACLHHRLPVRTGPSLNRGGLFP